MKCFPTYVRRLPNGKEQGKFLSLDLGGTNFRVIVMELTPDQEFLMDSKIYAIPLSIMRGKILTLLLEFLSVFEWDDFFDLEKAADIARTHIARSGRVITLV